MCARSKVRVDVRTLLGTVSELRLHRLDGVPASDRLACYGEAAERVVAEWSKPERLLDRDHRSLVAVDVARKGPDVRRERGRDRFECRGGDVQDSYGR